MNKSKKADKIIDRLEEEIEFMEEGGTKFGFGNSFKLIERGQWERFFSITGKYADWLLACWLAIPGSIWQVFTALVVIFAAIVGVLMLPLIMLYVLPRYLKEADLVRRIKKHPKYPKLLERHQKVVRRNEKG